MCVYLFLYREVLIFIMTVLSLRAILVRGIKFDLQLWAQSVLHGNRAQVFLFILLCFNNIAAFNYEFLNTLSS